MNIARELDHVILIHQSGINHWQAELKYFKSTLQSCLNVLAVDHIEITSGSKNTQKRRLYLFNLLQLISLNGF